jgi:threonine dehydratase
MDEPPTLVTLDDIERAAVRLREVAVRTPVEESRALSRIAGRRVLLKFEHLQRTGSFKIRGAYNRIALLSDEERARGVVCASAGNHAQGVALSARLAGVPATVFMPEGAALPKVEATRGYGAEVVLAGSDFDESYAACVEWQERTDAVLVHPFEHPDVIAGQGTVGLEIAEQVPEVGSVVVAVGGGGLAAGVATALKALRPPVRVIGVEAAPVAPVRALLGGRDASDGVRGETIADGIAVREPGALTLAHVREHVDDVVEVADQFIARAVLLLAERAKQVVEPAGAAPAAAVLEGLAAELPEPVVLVLGGGNVDPMLLLRIIRAGMGEECRTWAFRTRLPDVPGALSQLVGLIARERANIVAVEHYRYRAGFDLEQVEVYLELETRGPDHVDELRRALGAAGYGIE